MPKTFEIIVRLKIEGPFSLWMSSDKNGFHWFQISSLSVKKQVSILMTRSACVLLSILCSPASSWQKSSFKLLTNDSSGHRAAGLIFFSQFYWDGGLASVLGRISLYPLRVFPIARDVQSTCAVMEISCYSKVSVGNKETKPQMSSFG